MSLANFSTEAQTIHTTIEPSEVSCISGFPALEERISETLYRLANPVLQWSNSALGYYSNDGRLIRIIGGSCLCDSDPRGAVIRNRHTEQTIVYNRRPQGAVVLCCPDSLKNAGEFLAQLVDSTIAELARQEDEEELMAELGNSWENLQAVYDLHADLHSTHNLNGLLARITERVAAIGEGTKAVLWLCEGSELKPAASTNTGNLTPRERDHGLIGDLFSKQTTYICNNVTDPKIFSAEETELHNAFRLASFPVATRINNYGVLFVWQESDLNLFDSHTISFLNTLTMQAAMIIETNCLHAESIQNEKLQQEIEIGSSIHKILLTENPPESIRGLKISALTIPSNKIDGDFYDFIEFGDDCVDLIVGDVMGKGIPAALVGAATKNCFLRSVVQLQALENDLRPAPEKIVGWVNNEMTSKLIRFESFVTVCYARFDLKSSVLTYVDCGHTKTIHLNGSNRQISFLEGENMPLGFSVREVFTEEHVPINDGDLLFFYSDGITETRNSDEEIYGDRRLADFIRENDWREPKEMIRALLEALYDFSGKPSFQDDLTCVAIRIDNAFEVNSHGKLRIQFESDLSELRRAREFVEKVVRLLVPTGVKTTFIEQFQLAVNEALTNIVLHAYRDQRGNRITAVAERFGGDLQISLYHTGDSFDPNTVDDPVFDGSRDGGFGLYIISNCVDHVYYFRHEGRNSICLVKKIES